MSACQTISGAAARALLALLAVPALASAAFGQSLAQRIAETRDGTVAFQFAARAGICGNGMNVIRVGRSMYFGSFDASRPMAPCDSGPVQIRLTMDGGAVRTLQYWVGAPRSRGGRDLGAVPAREAADWLMREAARGAAKPSSEAIMPAVLADSAEVWPALLAVAKDSATRSRATRTEALTWLARFAGAALAGRRNDPLDFDEEPAGDDEELKAQAVFVLSQLPHREGNDQLLDVARSNRSPFVRRKAFFWLAESGDPRVIALFEAVLRS